MKNITQVLEKYRKFLEKRRLAKKEHIPYLLNWVEKFLWFARDKARHKFEHVLEMYQAYLESNKMLEDWQISQATDAVIIYKYQFRKGMFPDEPPVGRVMSHQEIVERARQFCRLKRYARTTENTYIGWISRFLIWLKKSGIEHAPKEEDVKGYLTHLVIKRYVSASTQNQAFSALLFLCRYVLNVELKEMAANVRSKRGRKLPAVLSEDEVWRVIQHTPSKYRLMIRLIYGAGLRKMELLRLRVKDIDFECDSLVIRDAKGGKDRVTVLPEGVREELGQHLAKVKKIHEADLADGHGAVYMPGILARKYPSAARKWGWQFAFPADNLSVDPERGVVRRHHVYKETLANALQKAVAGAGITKHVNVHTLRHSFATHLLLDGTDIREIQDILGHKKLETTMIYTHIAREMRNPTRSPLDKIEGERAGEHAPATP